MSDLTRHSISLKVGALLLMLSSMVGVHAREVVVDNQPKIIPTLDSHGAFLLNDWKPGAQTLILLVDVFCPYCITALDKRERLDNYNVFLFWSPILGTASVSRTEEIFYCDDPVGERVLNAISDRRSPQCGTEFDQRSWSANEAAIDSYNPSSVPAYYLGGRRVSAAQLLFVDTGSTIERIVTTSSVSIQWSRFASLAVNPNETGRFGMALVLPSGRSLSKAALDILRRDSIFNWYLIEHNAAPVERWRAAEEFRLLLGFEEVDEPVFVLEGRSLSQSELRQLVSSMLLERL